MFTDQFKSPLAQVTFRYRERNVLRICAGPDSHTRRTHSAHAGERPQGLPGSDYAAVGLLGGDVDWKSVMAALAKMGYGGFMSPEITNDPSGSGQLRTDFGSLTLFDIAKRNMEKLLHQSLPGEFLL